MDVGHPKHVLQTKNCVFVSQIYFSSTAFLQIVIPQAHIGYMILANKAMCGFIAQLVEHRTGIAKATGSNPVEALIFFSSS